MGEGWKQWTRERLTSAEVQGFLMDQSVMAFASAAARTAELLTPHAGMITYLQDVDRHYRRDAANAAWQPLGVRHWGAVSSFPVLADGLAVGDTVEHTGLRCVMVYTGGSGDSSKKWRQQTVALVDDRPGRVALEALSGGLHDGFLVHELTGNRRYSWDGVASWVTEGGPHQSPITSIAGFWTAASNWTVSDSLMMDLGHGMALVTVMCTRANIALTVPATGDINNLALCTLAGAQSKWLPVIQHPLQSADNGRVATGYYTTAGVITLAALAPGADVAIGGTVQLSGIFRLADPSAQT